MESFGIEDFNVDAKNPSEEALQKWRKLYRFVKNPPKLRFRFTANLSKRAEAAAMRRTNLVHTRSLQPPKTQKKLWVAVLVSKAAMQFIQGINPFEYKILVHDTELNFELCGDELGSIVEGHDAEKLNFHGNVSGIAEKLNTCTTKGLNTDPDEMKKRQNLYGINKFADKETRNFFVFLWEAMQNVTLLILGICGFVLLVVGVLTEGWPHGAYNGLGILASIFLVVFVTATSDYRQSLQFKDLDKEKKNVSIQVTRNGFRQNLSIYDLLPGDIAHLEINEQVPADGLYISGSSLSIDESSLTGESMPVSVTEEFPYLLSGTKVQSGSCNMMVTAVGMRTRRGKLMSTLSEGGNEETPLQVKVDGVAAIIGVIGFIFAVITFAVQGLLAIKWGENSHLNWDGDNAMEYLEYFAIAVTIVVVAVPDGLPPAVTLSLAFAMKRMMNEKALVRQLAACETMGSSTTICSDKTGTLTTNHMTVVKSCVCMKVREKVDVPVSSVKVLLLESIFNNTEVKVNTTNEGKTDFSGKATEIAILEFGLALGGDFETERNAVKIVTVEPFNSTKKRNGVVIELPDGTLRAHSKGASEIVLASCDKFIDSNGDVSPLDDESLKFLNLTIDQFANEALRTLCLAYCELENGTSPTAEIPVSGLTCIAIVGIKDPVRPGVKESVSICRAAGITVRMVTGDNINTAKAIARECGILTDDGIAIEGPDFLTKTREELQTLIPKIQVMARSSPMDKHTLVKHLKGSFDEVVAVTGDGTNDAPALHEADIGLAMGISGTEVAKESADVIIMDDNFSTIVTVAKWGRSVYINIQKFVQFQLTINIVALIMNFSSACLSETAPLTSVQLLWVDMIMDKLGALALATEPPNDDLMKRAPVARKGNLISSVMWRNILGQAVYQLVVIWSLQINGKRILNKDRDDNSLILKTFIFNTFVFCQVFNEISSRKMEEINVFKGIFDNYMFVLVIGCTVVFQFVIVECLGAFANTVPLSITEWLLSVFIGFLGMPIAAALKTIPV